MRQVAFVDIADGAVLRRISVVEGDVTSIPAEQAVDILAISAFPNDYMATPGSVIGALARSGLSIARLAQAKEHDLRSLCSFWLSRPLQGSDSQFNVGRIACFEHSLLGAPPTLVGSFFRGLFPFVGAPSDSVVAMTLFAAGDAGYSEATMFDCVVEAAAAWMSRGLGIRELKIIIRDPEVAMAMAGRLSTAAQKSILPSSSIRSVHDVFLSFSSVDHEAATRVKKSLESRKDVGRVFDFRYEIDTGLAWQKEIDKAITSCRAVVALISETYLRSAVCQEELHQARLRHNREGGRVLFPLYWRNWNGDLALWLQIINARDCREADSAKLEEAVGQLNFRPQ